MTFDRPQLLRDARIGMATTPKSLPPKYFYDERGSELFDEITRLPEYYPTRAERSLLQRCSREIIDETTPLTLIELGAGSADKTHYLLDAMIANSSNVTLPDVTYLPVDVSADFLERSAERLRLEYPQLKITPVIADFAAPFQLPAYPEPALHAFLGSTIGNFTPAAAATFLSGVRQRMARADYFLLGADLRKDVHVLERAYNDAQGITAQFNKNALHVMNAVLGADFNVDLFEHRAVYNHAEHRIEMHLVSNGAQTVMIPGVGNVSFADGEYMLTEVSYKYDRAMIAELLTQGGLELLRWITDESELFALALARVRH
ncbi:MAG: L-histidine N(alpha)-methyltransferase [Gemmatimonadaceae bacterium]